MSPADLAAAGPQALKAFITARLDPLSAYDPAQAAPRSDYDLNPELRPGPEGLGALHPAAVLIGLVEGEDGLNVILTRRSDSLKKHTGQIAFPGGRCDPGETPWQAALREAEEEIGLDPAFVTVAGLSSGYQTGTGFHVTPVVGFVRPGFSLTPSEAEVADVFQAPFAFLMDPANHQRQFHDTETGVRRYFYAMPYGERRIWGATAGMVRDLHDRLFPVLETAR